MKRALVPRSHNATVVLLLDGHDPLRAARTVAGTAGGDARQVTLLIDTPKTVLLPSYLARDGAQNAYLRFNGKAISAGERAVTVQNGDVAAIMAIDGAILDMVGEKWGEQAVFASPLLEIATGAKRNINVFLTPANTYITVWDKGLRYAEVFPDPSVDSVLYYLQTLGKEFSLRKFDIAIGGENSGEAVAAAGEYFKNVKYCPFCV